MVEHMAKEISRDQLLAFDEHFRPQATSDKQQATSGKLRHNDAWTKIKNIIIQIYESFRIR
jgi:hypothetical protein